MTDLMERPALTGTGLPVGWYFDPGIAALEQQVLFDAGPGYVGHELLVPQAGDFHTLDWLGQAKTLVRNGRGVELLGNVCRHRQSTLLEGRGNARNIVCPLHRWTYDLEGRLLGAPHFPGQVCLDLPKTPLKRWNGLLFSGPRDPVRDLQGLGIADDFNFDGYVLHKIESVEYDFNWKTFIEVYLEDYHVEFYHPGLNNFVDCGDLRWEFSDHYNVQVVGVNSALARPGSGAYRRWHEQVLAYGGGASPKYGAIWMLYYPNLMLEWYPNVLVVSTILPRGPERCLNVVEYYYPEDIALFEPDYIAAELAAYHETALEDEAICKRMNDGRRALHELGRDDQGPYQSPMEDGLVHFHEFIHRQLDPHLR